MQLFYNFLFIHNMPFFGYTLRKIQTKINGYTYKIFYMLLIYVRLSCASFTYLVFHSSLLQEFCQALQQPDAKVFKNYLKVKVVFFFSLDRF